MTCPQKAKNRLDVHKNWEYKEEDNFVLLTISSLALSFFRKMKSNVKLTLQGDQFKIDFKQPDLII